MRSVLAKLRPAARPEPLPELPRRVFLPDWLFFVRSVEIGASTAEEAASQAELALEAISPFPLTQLFYGHFWVPGSARALVFAAHRRHFSAEQVESWAPAECVLPLFAAALGRPPAPGAVFLAGEGGVTGLRWESAEPIPSETAARFAPEEPARSEHLRDLAAAWNEPESAPLETLLATPDTVEPADDDEEIFAFARPPEALPALVSRLPRAVLEAMDVRDKAVLAERRQGRRRDLFLWRGFLVAAALVALSCLTEAGLLAGQMWRSSRESTVVARAADVQKIETAGNLANKIEELSTRRLPAFQMLELINPPRPKSVQFSRVVTDGLYKLEVEAQATNPADVDQYRQALEATGSFDAVALDLDETRDGRLPFRLRVTFKPEALRPPAATNGAVQS